VRTSGLRTAKVHCPRSVVALAAPPWGIHADGAFRRRVLAGLNSG
jgi:hypothetical protein